MGHRINKGNKTLQKDRRLRIDDDRLTSDGETVKTLAYNLQDINRGGEPILAHMTPLAAQLLQNVTTALT